MLKQRHEQIQILVRLTDILVCIGAFFIAHFLRSSSGFVAAYGTIGKVESLIWMLAASLTIHLVLYPVFGFYQSLRLRRIPELLLMVAKAFAFEFFILGALVFLVHAKETSRYFFGIFLAVNYFLVAAEKVGIRTVLSTIRRRGYNYRQVLIVGMGPNAVRVIQALRRNKHWGYIPAAVLSEDEGETAFPAEVEGTPVLGTIARFEQVIQAQAIDEVYFAPEEFTASKLSRNALTCEKLGIPARFSLSLFDLPNSQVTFGRLERLPVLTFYTTLFTPVEALAKRVMDIVISVIGLVLTACLYPWIAYRIRKDSPGPVIFKQLRVGENGRRFKCYKFRTMYVDAEARKAELVAANKMQGPLFKVENDPRIFPFGQFLRRSSLDELPQFFNILRGDMSVVGTRPPTLDEVNRYETEHRRRLSIKPGLTGLWQVSGRNEITQFDDVVALDLKYIDSWSLWLDVKIIFRTVWVIFARKGAY